MQAGDILVFLNELKNNNSREWMTDNKNWYKETKEYFEHIVQTLLSELSKEDKSIAHLTAKELTFKLNRDTRFSHDKSPYNPSFRAHISPGGHVPIPVGYYINIEPGNIFLGGGLFAPQFNDATTMVRDYLVLYGKEFMDMVSDETFTSTFKLIGEKLKNVPKGYDSELPQAEYLKCKSWALEYPMQDVSLSDETSFYNEAVQKFQLMRPFNDYINTALKDFTMPARP